MPDRAPRLFQTYVSLLLAGGMGALALAASEVRALDPAIVGGFVVAAFLAQSSPARPRPDITVSLINVVLFCALLVAGRGLAVVAAVAAVTAMTRQVTDRPGVRLAFNAGMHVVSTFLAGTVFLALGGVPGDLASVLEPRGVGVVLVSALVLTVANNGLMAVTLRLTRGERLWQAFLELVGSAAVLQVFYVGLSIVAAVLLLEVHAIALVLLLVPALVARSGLLGFQAETEAYDRMVRAFVKAIEVKDGYTRGHAERVATLAEEVASELGFAYDDRVLARYGALLHDVGKIGIPLTIINKRGPLDDEEFARIREHPETGAEMLRDIDFLGPAVEIVRYHHERMDGRGYPHGVAHTELPPLVRIVTAVDAFDAMTSTRSYRRALDVGTAMAELRRCAGAQFDPDVVDALDRVVQRLDWQPTIDLTGPEPAAPRRLTRAAR